MANCDTTFRREISSIYSSTIQNFGRDFWSLVVTNPNVPQLKQATDKIKPILNLVEANSLQEK